VAFSRWLVGGLAAAMLAAAVGLAALSASDSPECPPSISQTGKTSQQAERRPGADQNAHSAHNAKAGQDAEAGHHGETDHHAEEGHGGSSEPVTVGPTCNLLEATAPPMSSYVPDVAAASAADRRTARELLDGVNEFCRTHTAADITTEWRPGTSNPNGATHYFNPSPGSKGLDPANPRAALVYGGELGGVMFTGKPLPRLGSIPRAHSHDSTEPVEMVHVYCTDDLTEAFTPSRLLGVTADSVSMRTSLRPAVMTLGDTRLTRVLAHVRRVAGDELPPVEPFRTAAGDGPDPVRQAMRTELRRSLMLLSEEQLRELSARMRLRP
jgi:hypothetical protein